MSIDAPAGAPTSPVADDTAVPSFIDLGLPEALAGALERRGIISPFPIQSAAIPDALAGHDILGRGQTGSGKTLAFGLPLLTQIAERRTKRELKSPRALILAPTRELACQINDTLNPYAQLLGVRIRPIFGGANMRPQIEALRRGLDVVVATPGRLQDLINQGECFLDHVEITVLDEADQMCDLGFLQPVTELLNLTPEDGQRLLFSATLDKGVQSLVRNFLKDPITHSVAEETSGVDSMTHHFLQVQKPDKMAVAAELLKTSGRSIVFVRTKRSADRIAETLTKMGVVSGSIHGDLAQNARTRALAAFSEGRTKALVATDVAARGIHVDGVRLVMHFDPPSEHKSYLHRSGRTARAGEKGVVATLLTHDQVGEVNRLRRSAGIAATVRQVHLNDADLTALFDGAPVGSAVDEAPREPRRLSPGQQARSEERAARHQHGDAPVRREFKPASERPARTFDSRPPRSDARPARSFDDRAARPVRTGDDRPARTFDSRPPRSDARPARSFEDRPARPVRTNDDRPARTFDSRPPRSDARPARSFDDRPARWDSRPGRPDHGSQGRPDARPAHSNDARSDSKPYRRDDAKPSYRDSAKPVARTGAKPQGGDHRAASRPTGHDPAKPAGRGQQQVRKVKPHRGQAERPNRAR